MLNTDLHPNRADPDAAGPPRAKSAGVLAGVRVIDMTRVVAGPLAAQNMADLGADVIKVERRGDGDDLRTLGPPWVRDAEGQPTGHSTYFQAVNRGKRSISLDFAQPAGADVLRRLAAGADVLIENFRAGTLQRYGLGYRELAALNPRLIYCSITGFGQEGPYADRSGYDYLVQAMGGGMSVTGHADGAPLRVGIPLADICAGNNASLGIMAALLHRERTGLGQQVDIALFDSQIAILLNAFSAWLNGGAVLPRTGNDHPSAVPNGVFPTQDGHVLISTFNDREFAVLATAMGHPEWASDPRFIRSRDRVAHRDELVAAMSDELRTGTKAEWMARLQAARISCGPINTMADIETDPQVAARGMIVTLPHGAAGQVRVAGSPLKLSASPVRYERGPPLVGEHTDEILAHDLGMPADEIAALRASGVI